MISWRYAVFCENSAPNLNYFRSAMGKVHAPFAKGGVSVESIFAYGLEAPTLALAIWIVST